MNDTDRKQLAELFSVISEFLKLPEVSDYAHERRRFLEFEYRANMLSAYLGGETAKAVGQHLIPSVTDLLRVEMSRPLRYTPETPEQARMCVCGLKSHYHDDNGQIHWDDRRTCDGFTPATNEEEKAS